MVEQHVDRLALDGGEPGALGEERGGLGGQLARVAHAVERAGLVEQVDGLIRLLAPGVLLAARVRKGDRGVERVVGDRERVVHLEARAPGAEDLERLRAVEFADLDRVEAALERGVGADVVVVLVAGGRPDDADLAARERRLEQVGRVERLAHGRPGPDEVVQLVDEEDHIAVAARLVDDALEPLLELAAERGAGDEVDVREREHAGAGERARDFPRRDPLGQPLGDRRLADARLADEHRVVLRLAQQDRDQPVGLGLAAAHRLELVAQRRVGQVPRVSLQRVMLTPRQRQLKIFHKHLTHDHAHFVRRPALVQRHAAVGERRAVELDPRHAARHAVGVLDGDMVARPAAAVSQLVLRPARRDARARP